MNTVNIFPDRKILFTVLQSCQPSVCPTCRKTQSLSHWHWKYWVVRHMGFSEGFHMGLTLHYRPRSVVWIRTKGAVSDLEICTQTSLFHQISGLGLSVLALYQYLLKRVDWSIQHAQPDKSFNAIIFSEGKGELVENVYIPSCWHKVQNIAIFVFITVES